MTELKLTLNITVWTLPDGITPLQLSDAIAKELNESEVYVGKTSDRELVNISLCTVSAVEIKTY